MHDEEFDEKIKEVEHEVNQNSSRISLEEPDEEITGGLMSGA